MQRRRSCLTHGIIALGASYCLGVILFILVAPYLRRFWWVAIASDVGAPFVFLPVLPLLLLALFVRSPALGLAVAFAALAFVLVFRSALLPPVPPITPGTPLRVMTYNQLFSNGQPDAIIASIRRQHADIVAIQELSPSVTNAIQRDLITSYPYQWLEPDEGASGFGLLSRFPITHQIDQPESRSKQASIQVDSGTLTLINTHPYVPFVFSNQSGVRGELRSLRTYGTSQRQEQVRALLATVATIEGPLVVLGDFNTSDRDPLYAELHSRLHDAYRDSAWGFGKTFPSTIRLGAFALPIVRIDYIWTHGDLAAQHAYVDCNSGGSDHCLLVADVVWAGR